MQTIRSMRRWRRALAAVAASAVLAAACSSSAAPDIESLGLAITADIQAGSTFEVAVPATADTELSVVSAPSGVGATITDAPEGMIRLAVAVGEDTPRGAYNLALLAVRDGERYELGWAFEVVEPDAAVPTTTGSVATTQPAVVEAMLVVDTPQPGDVFSDLSLISGRTSTEFIGYRLLAGGQPIAQGSLETARGEFDVKLGFTNECCLEMLLEVFHPNDNGLMVSIPLTYPESN